MGCFDKVLDIGTGGIYGAVTGKGFDITGKGAAEKNIKDAQKAQAAALDKSLSAEERMFNKALSYVDPYHNIGAASLPQLMAYSGYTQDPKTGEYKFSGVPESPLYKWQKQQGEKDISRRLNMMGRGNSTFGMNAFRDFYSQLGANEAARQENTLLNLAKIGQGSAQSASATSTQQGNALASLYGNYANNMGNLYGQQGQLSTAYSPFNILSSVANTAAKFIPLGG